jgi:predicted DNA-binding transcriptional regulator AlpA
LSALKIRSAPRTSPKPTRPKPATSVPEAPLAPLAGLPRLAYRLDELAVCLGVSRRTIERERSAGRFPRPDLHIGKVPLWSPGTINRWVAEGGGQ